MIELIDTCPDVNVAARRVQAAARISARLRSSATGRASWSTGRATGTRSTAGRGCMPARRTRLAGDRRRASRSTACRSQARGCRRRFAERDADSAVVVAVGAGPELEAEAQQLWQDGKPDEYFFLEVYGSAVVEHLVTMTGARLCAWAESRHMAVLPHYSPGLSRVGDRRAAAAARAHQPLAAADAGSAGGRARVGDAAPEEVAAGGVRPDEARRSGAAADRSHPVRELFVPAVPVPPDAVPARAAGGESGARGASGGERTEAAEATPAVPLDRNAKYSVNAKALQRWSDERLSLDAARRRQRRRARSATKAPRARTWAGRCSFSTASRLGRAPDGYPIREQHCAPAAGDDGHTYMCRYMSNGEHLLVAIDRDSRLIGKPLNDVLGWNAAGERRRLLLRAGQPAAQVGPGARNDSFHAGAGAGGDKAGAHIVCRRRFENGRCSATAPWARSS